ncbi:MAG TPA: ABC transporter permease [Actinomycetota bacterium]|nr:ABC transporter permease [Actinomycetota bacterium]
MSQQAPSADVATAPPDADAGANLRSRTGLVDYLKDPSFWANWAVVVALVVLVLIFGTLSDVFLTPGNIDAILVASAILIVLTVGQTYVIVTAGIDLSLGSVVTFASVVLGWAFGNRWGIGAAVLAGLLAGLAAGLLNGVIIAKGKITDFIVTLGMLSVASGAALVLSDGRPVQVQDPLLLDLAAGAAGPLRYMVLLAVVVAVLAHVLLFHTRFGTHLLATGGSAEVARAMGINVARIKIAAYTISGLLGGLAGVMLTARVGAAEPVAATALLLSSVAAVVLGGVSLFGGRGTVVGPVVGAVLLTALVNGLTLLGVSQFYQPIAVGSVVILSALLTRWQT